MGGITKYVFVFRVERGGALPDHLHIAKPGLERRLHVLVTPLLDWCPLPPTCITTRQVASCCIELKAGPGCIVHLP